MEETFTIEIPTDEDGFILLKCPKCEAYFKVKPDDYKSDEVVEIWCPACGMTSDSYFTEEVLELAKAKVLNAMMGEIHDQFKKMERSTKDGLVSIKAGKKPEDIPEKRIETAIDALEIIVMPCCDREAKMSALSAESIYYCPFCGDIHYADR